ncbi:hypothetical protein B0H10DRAFT_1937689 [Mycena sp. CBHHK59/15]|nr:hypothetical protein B0H10DRAFT_1937689 [Mycena sp. CBHHK59/15]
MCYRRKLPVKVQALPAKTRSRSQAWVSDDDDGSTPSPTAGNKSEIGYAQQVRGPRYCKEGQQRGREQFACPARARLVSDSAHLPVARTARHCAARSGGRCRQRWGGVPTPRGLPPAASWRLHARVGRDLCVETTAPCIRPARGFQRRPNARAHAHNSAGPSAMPRHRDAAATSTRNCAQTSRRCARTDHVPVVRTVQGSVRILDAYCTLAPTQNAVVGRASWSGVECVLKRASGRVLGPPLPLTQRVPNLPGTPGTFAVCRSATAVSALGPVFAACSGVLIVWPSFRPAASSTVTRHLASRRHIGLQSPFSALRDFHGTIYAPTSGGASTAWPDPLRILILLVLITSLLQILEFFWLYLIHFVSQKHVHSAPSTCSCHSIGIKIAEDCLAIEARSLDSGNGR